MITMQRMSTSVLFSLIPLFLLFPFLIQAKEAKRETYVVYMGAVPVATSSLSLKQTHLQLLSSVLKREENAEMMIVRRYEHGFSGFAAKLLEEEADAIRKKEGVVSVFRDPMLQLHTTRSWEFLQETSEETDTVTGFSSGGSDTIVGMFDTGIWPESKSFHDTGFGAIPSRWKGVCMNASDFTESNCNKKLIGARYYDVNVDHFDHNPLTPRDYRGHGTHTSSTAAGNSLPSSSYYGLAPGTARGGSPSSRLAVYRVCGYASCPGSALLAGFDDAIADGVDILSLSTGFSAAAKKDFSEDPIAIGSFHAAAKGVLVVCSAGNDGPNSSTVVNTAPWILTVAATTIDREFESDVVLGGNNKAVKGVAINFSNLTKSAVYPLITGGSVPSNTSNVTSSSHCQVDSLDVTKIKGKIVLCNHSVDDDAKSSKADTMQDSGVVGVIFFQDSVDWTANNYGLFPVTEMLTPASTDIFSYINSNKNPVATILPSITVDKQKPAPSVAYFSSRGPSAETRNLLKPDISAPGVNILASWIPTDTDSSSVPPGEKPTTFNLDSGTSMACPHVTGVAATVKSWNPSWSPSAIRSAIMTTANQLNNNKAPMTTETGSTATPYDKGAGEVNPTSALQPGLVYELETDDYITFLCNYGYNSTTIKLITKIPDTFKCPSNSSSDLISNLNYPSIAVSKLTATNKKVVTRVVTNVGSGETATYTATVKSPPGVNVVIVPNKLQFTKNVNKISYQVTFSLSSMLKNDVFGSITWSDRTHRVRSPIVVSIS